MEVRPVSQQTNRKNTVLDTVTKSLAAGVIASEAHRLFIPAETRAALKNTSRGLDSFVQKSIKAAEKTMKNTGKTFDLREIAENAKNMYPDMLETAKSASKKLNKTLLFVSGAVLAGLTAINLIVKNNTNKAEK
jgi:DNA topoisomerase VI subunit B